jgi:formimidoylglutamate deiminase
VRNLRIAIDAAGDIAVLEPDAVPDGAERLAGPVVPGMPNLHSHAFQRAMAGLTERASERSDSFWSWRDIMYRFVARLEPEDVQAIAAQLYVEMLKAGYTAVGEFHYLHHDRDGRPYDDRSLLGGAVIEAAAEAGIGITLLPVLYQTGAFGGAPAGAGQRRFINGTDDILSMIEVLRRRHAGSPDLRIGLAPHSLRAVPPDALSAAVSGLRALDATAPIHIHIAEQSREVDECLAWSGRRPVEWLLDHASVDAAWCLVHATHMNATETARLAAAGAVAGLCPTTEGNLGDGFFPLAEFLAAGGLWGIGSDSHISVNPVEELRWLEYGQRLLKERRNVTTAGTVGSTGAALWHRALAGGAIALGRKIGALAPGYRADILVLDAGAPSLYGRSGDLVLDALVFAGIGDAIRDVMVGGKWVVRDRLHDKEDEIAGAFRQAIDRLSGD